MRTMLLVPLVLALSACCGLGKKSASEKEESRPMAQEPDTGGHPGTGDEGYAYLKDDTAAALIVYPSEALADAWDRAIVANDKTGMAEVALLSYGIEPGTKVLVLQWEWSRSRVRIKSGENAERVGYIPSDFLHRKPPVERSITTNKKRELDAAAVANVLGTKAIAINCKPGSPVGASAKASERLDCDMPRAPGKHASILAFKSKEDFAATAKAYAADTTIGAALSNPLARVMVILDKDVPADVSKACKATISAL